MRELWRTLPTCRIGWQPIVTNFLLLAAALLIGWQLSYLGVADDNDFPKLIGRSCLGPADPGSYKLFEYVSFDYRYEPKYCWDSNFLTSAHLPFAIARLGSANGHLDLRWIGAVYGLLFLCALVLLPRPGILLAAILVFCNATYVPHFNSFYLDSTAFITLLWSVVLAARMAVRRHASAWEYAALTLSLCLLALSKGQHSLLPLGFLPLLWTFGRNWWRIGATVLLLLSIGAEFRFTPAWYSSVAVYNALFYQALPKSLTPQADLAQLGLPDMADQIGKNAYSPNSPMDRLDYIQNFGRRAGPAKLAVYYATHPVVAGKVFLGMLEEGSWLRVRMRVGDRLYRLGNFTLASGQPPEAQSYFLDIWTSFKVALFGGRPLLYLVYILSLSAAFVTMAWKRGFKTCIWLASLVALEAAVGMSDGVDHGRHLFLLNTLLDIMAVALVALMGQHRARV